MNKTQILRNAQSYMAKGNIDRAIEEWKKLISESPNDGNIYNTIGDLYTRKNDPNKAVDSYLKAAEAFNNAGFALKSIALYKKILKLSPKRHDVHLKLSDINAERGLTGNAIEGYLAVAKQYNQDGRVKDAIGVYRKIANLDPKNISIRLNLAELCFIEGFEEEAVKEYLQLAKAYTESGQTKEAEATYEKILKLDPKNEDARTAIGIGSSEKEKDGKEVLLSNAEAAVEEGAYDKAEQLLRQLTATDPGSPVYQEKLGYLFLKKGQHFMAFPPFKAAVQVYLENGEADRAAALMKDYLSQGSDQIEAHQLLATASEQQGDIQGAISQFSRVIDEHLSMNEMDQARSLYQKIKGLDAGHLDVLRLCSTFERSSTEEPAEAIESSQPETSQVQELVEVLETSQPEVRPLPETVEALELTQPGPIEVQKQAETLESTQPGIDQAHEPVEVLEPREPEIKESQQQADSLKLPADEMESLNLLIEAEMYTKYGLVEKAIEQLKQVLKKEPDNAQAHLQLKDIYQANDRKPEAAEECLTLAAIYKTAEDTDAYDRILQEANQLDPELPRLKEETPLADLLDSDRMEAILSDNETDKSSVTQDSVKPEFQLQAERDVAEEAGEAETVKTAQPFEESEALEKASEESIHEAVSHETLSATDSTENVTTEEPAVQGDDFIDLPKFLEEEMKEVTPPPQPASSRDEALRSVISVFHDKETEAQQEDIDPETHYDLGIAYSEMGLINEAIEEFKQSSQGPDRFIDSCNMLSACLQKKGLFQEALQPLVEALDDPRCGNTEGLWLSYELALLYERLNRLNDAFARYSEIYSKDKNFKDVKQRLDTLRDSIKKNGKKEEAQQQNQGKDEDVDSMLERLFDNSLSDPGFQQSEQKDPNKKKSRIS